MKKKLSGDAWSFSTRKQEARVEFLYGIVLGLLIAIIVAALVVLVVMKAI